MILAQPSQDQGAKFSCEIKKFVGFKVGNDTGAFIRPDISLFSEAVKTVDHGSLSAHCERKGLNDPIMAHLSGSAVTCRGQRRRRRPRCGIIGDVESPIRIEVRRAADRKVAIERSQDVGYLSRACLVLNEPAALLPIAQAQAHLRSEDFFSFQDRIQKMMSTGHLRLEFGDRIDRRVDLAIQAFLGPPALLTKPSLFYMNICSYINMDGANERSDKNP
jgi:hypothetical protein